MAFSSVDNDKFVVTRGALSFFASSEIATGNQDLSQRRADAVAAILMQDGVRANRLIAYGRGESLPVASNLTPEGRALNRRVEIHIRPNNG